MHPWKRFLTFVGQPTGLVIVLPALAFTLILAFPRAAPAQGSWSDTGSLNTARTMHAAAPVVGSRVLVAGGMDGAGALSTSAELFDPYGGRWRTVGSLNQARWYHTATPLPDGRVLVIGGEGPIGS